VWANSTQQLPSLSPSLAGRRWLTSVILATQEAEIRRISVWSQPGQIVRCWELKVILHVWVWHSPKPQKGPSRVMSSICLIGTASAAEVDKMQYSCFS
jgi:hypothetical protein